MTAAAETVDYQALVNEMLDLPGRMTDTYSRFYPYSFTNMMLLAIQGAKGPVATYKRWGEMGHQVRKGEKAMSILRPTTAKRTEVDAHGQEVEKRIAVRFKMVRCIFQVAQTDAQEGASPLPDLPPTDWALETALAALDILSAPFEHLDGNVAGYSTAERTLAINPVAKYPVKTALHEIAHILLDHLGDGAVAHQGIAEWEAEATAYLAANELGLPEGAWDRAESRAYIQGWLGGQRPEDASVRRVFSTVDRIIKAGRPAPAGE